jgi:3-hydroxy acid dehydrogenase/malonic semialdehyde reductase
LRFHGDDKKAEQVYANTQSLTADDIAESVYWVTTLPAHVNVLELMPVTQAPGPLTISRRT